MEDEMMFTIGKNGKLTKYEEPYCSIECKTGKDYEELLRLLEKGKMVEKLDSIEEWNEDDGDCLWWSFPVVEAPYCGSPLDCNFPKDVTHFTKIVVPQNPKTNLYKGSSNKRA